MNDMFNKIVSVDITYEQMLSLIPALFAGILLGVFFFAGLWWTIRQGAKSAYPVVWFFSSFLLRSALALFAIYWIIDGQWSRLLVCMFGFTLARIAVQIIIRYSAKRALQQESGHAP